MGTEAFSRPGCTEGGHTHDQKRSAPPDRENDRLCLEKEELPSEGGSVPAPVLPVMSLSKGASAVSPQRMEPHRFCSK